jgi:hypothetical protein
MWHKKVVHLRDIRLLNNAGISFPLCLAGATRLDMDATGRKQTNVLADVTCPRCRTRAPRRYPWAYKSAS